MGTSGRDIDAEAIALSARGSPLVRTAEVEVERIKLVAGADEIVRDLDDVVNEADEIVESLDEIADDVDEGVNDLMGVTGDDLAEPS